MFLFRHCLSDIIKSLRDNLELALTVDAYVDDLDLCPFTPILITLTLLHAHRGVGQVKLRIAFDQV